MPKNDVTVEMFYNGVWNDITDNDEVFTDSAITIIQGNTDEMGSLRSTQINMRLDNSSDKYRVSNPLSPLYRLVGRNTPLKVTVGSAVRGIAEVNSWKCDESQDFRKTPRRGKSWTDISASGILARVNKWGRFIRSPLYRAVVLSGTDPAEYWDMEIPSGGSEAPSAVSGSSLTPVTTVRYTVGTSVLPPGGAPDFGSGNGVPGSAALPGFQNGGTLAGPIRKDTFNGYAIDWVMQFEANTDAGGTTSADVLRWTETGTYVEFTVNVTKDFVTVFHSNVADKATGSFTGSATAALDVYDGAPHHFRYQVRQSGGNYRADIYIDSANYATADNFVPGMTGTVGRPSAIEWNPGEDRGDYMPVACGHLVVWKSGQLGDQPPVFFALNGYAGETAGDRMDRLCDEENITFGLEGTAALSREMGPQKPDTLYNLMQEIKNTDDGLVYDDIDVLGIIFKIRSRRYNRTPTMTLYPSDFPALPVEVTDDLDTNNIVTARQRDGGEATAEDSTSFLGSQAPPSGVGEEKTEIDVNLYDPNTYLIQEANWWMRRGTVDLPRYPQLVLDLNASPHLVTAANDLVVGAVIEIVGLRENVIRLFVLGWTETIGTHSRKMVLTCKPDQQFVVGEYDDTAVRYDLASCTLNGVHSANATTLTLSMSSDEVWSTTSRYDIFIAGELITVPIGAMGARSGSGPYAQTATGVIRGVNGISKVLPTGSEVHVSTPGRLAL